MSARLRWLGAARIDVPDHVGAFLTADRCEKQCRQHKHRLHNYFGKSVKLQSEIGLSPLLYLWLY